MIAAILLSIAGRACPNPADDAKAHLNKALTSGAAH